MSNLFKLLKPASEKIVKLKNHAYYSAASLKNRYPCQIVGEKYLFENKETTILYALKSKREVVYEITVSALLEDQLLLEKFHPQDAVKIGCIAMGDTLFNSDINQKEKYQVVIKKMMYSDKS